MAVTTFSSDPILDTSGKAARWVAFLLLGRFVGRFRVFPTPSFFFFCRFPFFSLFQNGSKKASYPSYLNADAGYSVFQSDLKASLKRFMRNCIRPINFAIIFAALRLCEALAPELNYIWEPIGGCGRTR